jgi:acyl-CoA reductase-like NAD-dependent aldehyde dehydrogenase
MAKMIAPDAEWARLLGAARDVAPEAFGGDGQPLNLIEGAWGHPGHAKPCISPVDGTLLGSLPMLDPETALRAVRFCRSEFETWSSRDLDTRRQLVSDALELLRERRDLIARLLMWEIGKPYAQALTDVDRCISGVAWYVQNIEGMLAGRTALGVISNIASWNYPLSVLVHAVLVQALAGNSVIAKTPTDGGLFALTVSFALARRAGLPVTLVSGSGGQLSEVLVRNPDVDCLAFVGGRSNGRDIASSLFDRDKRYMLEMEGVNAYGIWNFSDWASLAQQLKKGFDYGKQRCTAYVRFVVQRQLFPKFLDMYLPVLKSLRYGNPLLVESPGDPLPTLDFGPLINSKTVEQLNVMYSEAIGNGAIGLYEGQLDEAMFLPGQDISAYRAPSLLLNVPQSCQLYHKEPFGPIDTVVVVDRVEQLIAEMNISNGSLVASVATDDERLARELASDVRAFKVGVNRVRSRGDNEEVFGGIGQSWKGCFVGGKYLVQSVTRGPASERLYGNFPDYTLVPELR